MEMGKCLSGWILYYQPRKLPRAKEQSIQTHKNQQKIGREARKELDDISRGPRTPRTQRKSRKRRRNKTGGPKIFLEIQTETEQLSRKFAANRGKI